MGTGQRQGLVATKETSHMPGPGNYNTLYDSSTKKTAPKYGFGTGNRDNSEDRMKTKVGPGAYEMGGLIGRNGPKQSIHAKLNSTFQEKESRNKPGPG